MLAFLKRHKGPLAVGILLLMPGVMLYAQTRRGEGKGALVGALVDVAGVVERALLYVTGGLSDGFEHYVGSVASYDELARLRIERRSVDVLAVRVDELSAENERLRRLANATAAIDGPYPIGARVIGRTGRPLARLLTIDKGAAHGVRRGDGVVSQDGVVGVVLVAGRGHSDVIVLTDPASAVDVVVQRTRARGVLRGQGDEEKYAAAVEDFDRLRDVKPGDAIVTAGLGARFPPGLLAGTIVDVDDQGDLTLKAVVRPSADLARVELVAVLVGREGLAPATLGDEGIDLAPAPRIKRRARPKDDETAGTPTMPDGPSVPTADQPGAAEAADAGVPEPADASPAVTLSSDATPAPVMPPPPAPASPPPRAPPPAPVAPPPQDAGVTP